MDARELNNLVKSLLRDSVDHAGSQGHRGDGKHSVLLVSDGVKKFKITVEDVTEQAD